MGITIEDYIRDFLVNPYVLLIMAVAVLLIFLDPIERVYRFFRKPNLVFEPHKEIETIQEHGKEKFKMTFWVYVSNEGKEPAKNCLAQMKMTDPKGVFNVGTKFLNPYKDGLFPVYWKVLKDEKESIDIHPQNQQSGIIKIPMEIYIPKKIEDGKIMKYYL